MTDNEIIKALKCCIQGDQCAYSCPYDDDGSDCNKCTSALAKDALDLINRQKAEIEEFKSMQKPTETSGYKIENGKVVFYTNILNGYRHEYKDLDEVVKNLNLMLSFNYNADDVIMHYKAKSELFAHVNPEGTIILNGDDPILSAHKNEIQQKTNGNITITLN